ncbi:gamma-glutamylcyclotransferase family protein [Marinobacteraceae bacterium S3BR75-40.1]
MLYFAYGSNLSLARLRRRVPSARPLGIAELSGHRLQFHKAGGDGSAKCDAFHTGQAADVVLGRVYHIDPAEKYVLDRAESLGVGYEERQVDVRLNGDEVTNVFSYHALRINPRDYPYDWYRHHVEVGSLEAGLPEAYVEGIRAVPVKPDPVVSRARHEWDHYPDR